MSGQRIARVLTVATLLSICLPPVASADISCEDFVFVEDAQAIINA
jgi:hypothetical protein